MSKKIGNQGDSKPQSAMVIDASKPAKETVRLMDHSVTVEKSPNLTPRVGVDATPKK